MDKDATKYMYIYISSVSSCSN